MTLQGIQEEAVKLNEGLTQDGQVGSDDGLQREEVAVVPEVVVVVEETAAAAVVEESKILLDDEGLKQEEGGNPDNEGLKQEEGGVTQTEETDKGKNDAASVKEGVEDLHQEKQDEKEEGGGEECGFCLFMKAGPCGKKFSLWEKCVEEAESTGINIVEKCAPVTHLLKDCMELHPEYYGPVLQAEKAMEAQSAMEAAANKEEMESGSTEVQAEKAMESQSAIEAAKKEEVRESGSTEARAKLPA